MQETNKFRREGGGTKSNRRMGAEQQRGSMQGGGNKSNRKMGGGGGRATEGPNANDPAAGWEAVQRAKPGVWRSGVGSRGTGTDTPSAMQETNKFRREGGRNKSNRRMGAEQQRGAMLMTPQPKRKAVQG